MRSLFIGVFMKSGIYRIVCTFGGKVYVGSSQNIDKRWKEHKRNLQTNRHPNVYLQRSYNLYGLEAFIFEIIEECTPEQLIEREQFYLDIVFNFGNTFNIVVKAKNRLGTKHTEETKRKISEAKKGKGGRKLSVEHKQKLREVNLGKKHSEERRRKNSEGQKGRKLSEETRQKMSIVAKGRKRSQESIQKMIESKRIKREGS